MNVPTAFMQVPDEPDDSDVSEFKNQTDRLEVLAIALDEQRVTDHASLEKAESMLRSMQVVYDIVEQLTERFRKPAYDYYQRVLAEKNDILSHPKRAIQELRSRVQAYMLESGDDVESVSLRTRWKARLTEPSDQALLMLCSAIASGQAPADLVQLNEKYANKAAGILMDNMNYPGLEAYQDTSLVMKK